MPAGCGPGFRPLLVGLHWPSLPFGDEELGGGSDISFAAPGTAAALPDTPALVDAYADRIADTPAARAALETIFAAAAADTAPLELPPEVADAYRVLDREAGLGAGGPASAPGSDREPFDPEAAYESVLDEEERGELRRRRLAARPGASASCGTCRSSR